MTQFALQTTRPTMDVCDASRRLRGADWVVRMLEELGVEVVFGYPGGAIMPVYDALPGSGLKHVLARHEQGAVMAADAYARVSGKPGVCLATSGPGATNLLTGIANAFMDSVPLVCITGQVASPYLGTDGFQEVDIWGMSLPVVKHSMLVRHAEEIPAVLEEAFFIAQNGRPGPVLVDIPKDLMMQPVAAPKRFTPVAAASSPLNAADIARANAMLEAAEKPLFYLGGGVGIAHAVEEMRALVRRSKIPAVCTLKGLGVLSTEEELLLGMIGMHGLKTANIAVQHCDLLIAIGARFDDRATGRLDSFAPHAKVIHLDADAAEIGKLRRADLSFLGHMKEVLNALHPNENAPHSCQNWRAQTQINKQQFAMRYDAPGEAIYAPKLLKELSEMGGEDLIITCDVGQHQMWVAQHCQMRRPEQHLTSGGLGAMGYGLPAGIGALFARPDATVVSVSGDGSIMMNIQELATLNRYQMPLKILLLDNSALGMVRQWQELFFDKNYSEVDLSDNPDFARVAESFGLAARTLDARADSKAALTWLFAQKGPALLHVKIDAKTNVWPLVPAGKSNLDMMEG